MMSFKITFWKDIPERTFVIDETNFYPRYFIGLDGLLYENYGTKENPLWENVFDAEYEIEIIDYSCYEKTDSPPKPPEDRILKEGDYVKPPNKSLR